MLIYDMVNAVKKHALDHYNDKDTSWDTIVECWTSDEIAMELEKSRVNSAKGAIKIFAQMARLFHEQRLNARDW